MTTDARWPPLADALGFVAALGVIVDVLFPPWEPLTPPEMFTLGGVFSFAFVYYLAGADAGFDRTRGEAAEDALMALMCAAIGLTALAVAWLWGVLVLFVLLMAFVCVADALGTGGRP
jgi:hypothetical protein